MLGGFANGFGHLFCFTFTKAHAAFLITYNHQCRKSEALTALYRFRHAVDRYQAIGEFRCFVAIATLTPAIIFSCHIALLELQAALTGSICERFDFPVKQEAAAIEINILNTGLFGALRNFSAHFARCFDIVFAHHTE